MVVGLPTRMTYLDDHVPRYWCVSNALLFNSTAQCLLHFGYRHEGDIGGVVCLIVQLFGLEVKFFAVGWEPWSCGSGI